MKTKFNVIIIKGIKLADIKKIDKVKQFVEDDITYSIIPRNFTSVDSWVKYTNLLCWHCDKIIADYPRFIPKNPAIVNGEDVCEVYGNFHTWECALAYARKELPKESYWDTMISIKIFAQKFAYNDNIIPAPNKTIMKQYCGDVGITSEQYDKLIFRL
jgi:hypothetical protein